MGPLQTSGHQIDPLTAENRAELCKLFSIADPKLLMGRDLMRYVSAVANPRIAWPKEAGLEGTFASALKLALPLVEKPRTPPSPKPT